MEINAPVSGGSTSFYSPPLARPVMAGYLDTLSTSQLNTIISDLNYPGLWSTAAMEMVPFIVLNLPGWQNFSLRIEDEESHEVLFLPASSGRAVNMVVLQQRQSPSYQLFYQPLIAQHFEEISSSVYGDQLLIALCAARYDAMPHQIGSMEISRFRQQLSAMLADDEPCQHYINQHFRHWMPGHVVTDFPYRGNQDLFEQHLPQLGFTLRARGEDTHRQMPQIRQALQLFDDCLWHMLLTTGHNNARLKALLARQLNLGLAQVSDEMINETRAQLIAWQQRIGHYTGDYRNQFILSAVNDSRRGVMAEAFPDDPQQRIILTSTLKDSPFIQILRAIPHEISHMIPGDHRAEDLFYVLYYGIPDNSRTTETVLADMLEENSLAYTTLGFADLILSNILDSIQSASSRPSYLTAAQFSQIFEQAKHVIRDEGQWQTYLRDMQESYQAPASWLNTMRSSVYNHPVWQRMAAIAELEYHTPAQLLSELVADRRKLLKVVLRNADSLVLLVLEYEAEYIRDYLRNNHRQLNPQQRPDSTEILSSVSSTDEPYHNALAQPEILTPFQFFNALEDLALASVTASQHISAETPCNVMAGRFIRRAGRAISRALGALFSRGSVMPQLSHTLYLASLKRLLDSEQLTPQQVLNIISPDDGASSDALSDAIADNFWRDGKLLAWQQLIRDCFCRLPPHLQQSYRASFTSSECGRGFYRQVEAQLAVIENDPANYPEVINTLVAMVQDGLIPANYEVANRINQLRSANLPPGRPLINVDTLLKYTDENRVHIYNDYFQQLNVADMLAGIANLYGWYVVSENSEGDPLHFFDAQGNDITAEPPQLTHNETVLVLGQNALALYQQAAEGPRLILEQALEIDSNLSLLRAVEQLSGHHHLIDDNTLIRSFLRRMKLQPVTAASAADDRCLPPAPRRMSRLLDTEKINSNAKTIDDLLHFYFYQMAAEDIPLLEPRKPTPLKKMKANISEIHLASGGVNTQQDIVSISSCIAQIEENLRNMLVWRGIDSRLNYFHQLPRQFHLIRQHILNLRSAMRVDPRTKKNRIPTQQIKKLEKNTLAGMSRTLKTKGKLHSLIGQSSDGTPARLQLHLAARSQRVQPDDAANDRLSHLFASTLEILSESAFSEQHFQQCEVRDAEKDQQWLQRRAQRDDVQLQLRERAQMRTEMLVQQLAESWQENRERKRKALQTLPLSRTGGHRAGAAAAKAGSENAAPVVNAPPVALPSDSGQMAESPLPVTSLAFVAPESAAQSAAAGSGVRVNTHNNGTATLLLMPGTVMPPADSGRNIWPPSMAQLRPVAANGSEPNIMTFSQMISRNNRQLAPLPDRFNTLRLSTRRPPVTPSYPTRREPALRVRGQNDVSEAPEPVRQDILGHRRMVVSAQRNQLFTANGERTAQRQQLDRYIQNRRTLPDPQQQQAEVTGQFNRRMMRNETLLSGYYKRSAAQKSKVSDDG